MALTGSADINKYAINKFSKQFGENGAFILVTEEEMNDQSNSQKEGLFSYADDYVLLSQVANKYPTIHEIELNDGAHFKSIMKVANNDKDSIPLFIKDNQGQLEIITPFSKETNKISKGFFLVYLGKRIE